MTDNEIIKALKVCGSYDPCDFCPATKLQRYDSDSCQHKIMLIAADLIKRLQAEIEVLQRMLVTERNTDPTAIKLEAYEILKMMKHADRLNEQIECQKSEIESLRNGYLNVSKIRSEARKEFAEMVKMEFYREFDEIIPSVMAEKIDNLLEETEKETNDD